MKKIFSYSLVSFVGRIGTATANQLQTIVVGSLLGTAAVALFSIPFQLISRVMGISYRLSMIIFPVSSELSGGLSLERLHQVYLQMTRYMFFLSTVQVVIFSMFGWEVLYLWMGNEFADKAFMILTMIAVGYFFDTLTNLPSQVCDGFGHPRITSTFALIRGGIGILFTFVGGYTAGIQGIAAGYMLSCVIVSTVFNLYIHPKVIKMPYIEVLRVCTDSAFLGISLVLLLLAYQYSHESYSLSAFLIKGIGVASVFLVFGYIRVLSNSNRQQLRWAVRQAFGQLLLKCRLG